MKKIPVAQPKIGKLEKTFVNQCLKSSWISSTGEYISQFEDRFAQYCGSKYAVSCNNGTAALHLALLALGIKPGDEVLLPSLTFIATANVVKYCGATPVFIDSDKQSWNINPQLLEPKINKNTKAIIPVHLYGHPASMDKIMQIAKKYHLYVIEDAAEAHGATFNNKKVGTFGDIGCFSFYGNKIITTGEGGMCITDNKKIMEKIVLFKNHGMSLKKKYYHTVVGYNYRMTNIQAAIGLAQLNQIDHFLQIRKKIYTTYHSGLSSLSAIRFHPHTENIESVYWLFACLIKPQHKKNRNGLMHYLYNKGIDSRPFFHPITDMPYYKSTSVFRVAKSISQQGINLPTYVDLTNSDINFIVQTVKEYFA
jgi:perosamine synthetase